MTDEFAHRLPLNQIRDGERIDLVADEAERKLIADRLDLRSLDRLEAHATLELKGEIVRARGRLKASLCQSCVVTDDPVDARMRLFDDGYVDHATAFALFAALGIGCLFLAVRFEGEALAILGISEGLVEPDSRMPQSCGSYYYYGNRSWRCWEKGGPREPGPHRRDRQVVQRLFLPAGAPHRIAQFVA